MASLWEYIEKRSTEELQGYLAQILNGAVPVEFHTILAICETIARRDPSKKNPTIAFQEFLLHYLPEES